MYIMWKTLYGLLARLSSLEHRSSTFVPFFETSEISCMSKFTKLFIESHAIFAKISKTKKYKTLHLLFQKYGLQLKF